MTKRSPISSEQNIWFDSQQVDNIDLTVEQNHNKIITSGIINNHIGSGILPDSIQDNIIFDSLDQLNIGFLDGKPINVIRQPADNNFGNQIELLLSNSKATSKKTLKVCIIGLDFNSQLQYEIFSFKNNESQISKKHFTKILFLLFNDFIGDPQISMNLGGRIIIKDALPLSLSRDCIMVSQDLQPNLFFRDFYVQGYPSLESLLETALPYYNVDSLNIKKVEKDKKILLSDDVVTQIGQKFIATTNNIQKITLLLSAEDLTLINPNDPVVWNGDLVVSIYPLQSNISSYNEILPNLEIDYQPNNLPLAQISFNYNTLRQNGIVLDTYPQPVDFVFSNTPVAGGNVIIPGNYYAFTLKRSGSADKSNILISTGENYLSNSRITIFTGSVWVDLPEESLWFKIWTDSVKISDGNAYDTGSGITIEKVSNNKDNSLSNLYFSGNAQHYAFISAETEKSVPIPDQRTGQPVLSRKKSVPSINIINGLDLLNLQKASEPLISGSVIDKNKKYIDNVSNTILSKLYSATIINDEIFIRIIDDPTDTVRYDLSVSSLQTNLLNGDLVNAKIIPNYNNPSIYYRISDAKILNMILGDVDGDGLVTEKDLNLLYSYSNYNLNNGLPKDTTLNIVGSTITYENGYTTYTSPFLNLNNINFYLIDSNNNIVASGNDGVLTKDPVNDNIASFTSSAISFNSYLGITSYKLVVDSSLNKENYGAFNIIDINSTTDALRIKKVLLNSETILQIIRSDIDGDFFIGTNDGYLLSEYINCVPYNNSSQATYPAPSTNPYTKIGKNINVIKLKLEKFIDRSDDYSTDPNNRSLNVHSSTDIFLNDSNYYSNNFYTNPIPIYIEKQLSWEESLVVVNSLPKFVPAVLTSNNGIIKNIVPPYYSYDVKPKFDPGKIDYYIPDNIIIGNGEIQRKDGNFYKIDFEVGTIVLEVPDTLFGSERTINIFQDFIYSQEDTGILTNDSLFTGVTKLGFPAMRFADGSFVSSKALDNDQLRFSVSVQSFSPNTTGLSEDGYSGAIVDGKMGVAVDYSTGLLTLNFTNLYKDPTLKTLTTKIQINVFLKKGGFNNKTLTIDSAKVQNMLQLISVFSGANVGGASALINLENDVSGILPIIHGGTGLDAVGIQGQVLSSTGLGLSYQFIADLPGVIPYSIGSQHNNKIPKTDNSGLLDPSFSYKNPVYIYGVSGYQETNSNIPKAIGAIIFRFDKFILQGLSSIKLEAIIETNNTSNNCNIQLYSLNSASYINISGLNNKISVNTNVATFVASDDLKAILASGQINFIYEIHLSLDTSSPTDYAICKLARLVMEYDNPVSNYSQNFVPYLPP